MCTRIRRFKQKLLVGMFVALKAFCERLPSEESTPY